MEKSRKRKSYNPEMPLDDQGNPNYRTYFSEIAGREATPKDLAKIISEVSNLSGEKQVSVRGIIDNDVAFFNEKVTGAGNAGQVEPDKLAHIVSTFAYKDKNEMMISETKRERRNLNLKRLGFSLGLASILGIGAGFGYATFRATKDIAVKEAKAEYETKKIELEDKFFGPLEMLEEENEPCSISASERELYFYVHAGNEISEQLNSQNNLLYDNVVKNHRLVAKKFAIPKKDSTFKDSYFLLIKTDKISQNIESISSAYIYKTSDSEKLEDIIENTSPKKSILFSGNNVKVIDYEAKNVKVFEKLKVTYNGADIEPYKDHAERIIRDFKRLYARGPNIPLEIK